MNFPNSNPFDNNNNYNNEELECEEEEECNFIDQNDIIIIDDPDNWKPNPIIVASYANSLGFNPDKDPKELISIAEKYLTVKLPDNIRRAYMKDSYQILYIDTNTQEIKLRTEIEEQALEEFEKIRKIFQNQNLPNKKEKKGKKDDKNKKKGGDKRKTDEEFRKKLEEQKKYMDEEKRIEEKKDLIRDLNVSDEKKDEENDNENNENNFDELHNGNDEEILLEDNTQNIHNNNTNIADNDRDNSADEQKKNNNKNEMKNMKNNIINKDKISNNMNYDDYFDIDIDNEESSDDNNNIINNNKGKKESLALQLKLNDIDNEEYENEEVNNKNKNKNKKENELITDSDSDNKSNKKSQKINEKNDYLKMNKETLKKHRKKLKNDYIKSKKKYEEKFNMQLLEDNKNKVNNIKANLSKVQNINLVNYENTLKEQMDLELKIFKKKLIEKDYSNRDKNSIDSEDKKIDLEKQINKLEEEIRLQKEKNINRKNIQKKKNNNEINDKKSDIDKSIKDKYSQVDLRHNNKMNILEGIYQKKYNENIEDIKKKLNNELNISNNLKDDNNTSINKITLEYSNKLKEKFEEEKISFNSELEQSMEKNLEIYKKKIKNENEKNINLINEEINNLSKNYFMEIEIFKKNFSQRSKKEEENMKNEIQQISLLFDTIKTNHINNVNKEIQEFSETIKGNINDYNLESKIGETIDNKLEKEKIKLNELKSYINLIEIEYNNNKQNIECLAQIISYICKTINEKSTIIKIESNDNEEELNHIDDLLVSELIHDIKNKINEFQLNISENEAKNEIYTLLNNELKKIMQILDKNANNIKKEIVNNLLYSNDKININKDRDVINALKSDNIHRLNNPNIYINNRGNNIINNNMIENINNKYDNYKSSILNNINRLNESYSSFLNYNYRNNNSNNYNNQLLQQNHNSNLNNISINISNNINNTQLKSREYNLQNNNINEDGEYPILSEEILNSFSDDLINMYNKINQFLVEESNRIDNEILEMEKKGETNKKLEEVKNSEELNQYNMYFSQIYSKEKNNMKRAKKNIENKLKIFNIIKKNCEDTFNFISNNSYRPNIFRHKLNTLLTHINDYYQMNNFNLNSTDDLNNINNINMDLLSNKSYTINMNINNQKTDLFNENDNMIKLKDYRGFNGGTNRYDNNNFE